MPNLVNIPAAKPSIAASAIGSQLISASSASEARAAIGALATNDVVALQTGASIIVGDSVPGSNVGDVGNSFIDTVARVLYVQKTSSGWGGGVPYSGSVVLPTAKQILDLRYGNANTWISCARSSPATDLVYTDAPGRAYRTFAANEPIIHPDRGLGSFSNCTNFYLNSTAPIASQTITLAAGTYILWGNGPGSLAIAAGTAVGTGWGTLTTLQGNFLAVTITTAGTVVVTKTGTVNAVQLEGTDVIGYGRKGPTPLIVTAGAAATRAVQTLAIGGALLAAIQGAAGSLVFETEGLAIGAPVQAGRLLTVNGNGLLSVYTQLGVLYYPPGGSGKVWTTGNVNAENTRCRHGIAWSGASVSAVSGSGALVTHGAAWNDGNAVATAYIGTDAGGNQVMNGWMRRVMWWTSRLADAELQAEVTAVPAPVSAISNFVPGLSLPKWQAAKQRVRAGLANARVGILGASQDVGTMPTTNFRASSWPMQMAAKLAAATGLPVGTDSWFGYNNTGANWTTWDTRIAASGLSEWGASFGGSIARMAAGGYVNFTPVRTTDTYEVWYFTAAGRGTLTIRDGVGGAVLTTVSTAGATGLQKATVSAALASRTWVIEGTGEVVLLGGYAYNSAIREISVFLGGRSLWGAKVFTTGAAGVPHTYIESNAALQIPSLGLDCMFLILTVNDAAPSAPTPIADYKAYMTALGNAAKSTGDLVMQSSGPVDWGQYGFQTYAAELPYLRTAHELAYALGAPMIDTIARWGGTEAYARYSQAGWYYDSGHYTAPGLADIAIDPTTVLAA